MLKLTFKITSLLAAAVFLTAFGGGVDIDSDAEIEISGRPNGSRKENNFEHNEPLQAAARQWIKIQDAARRII